MIRLVVNSVGIAVEALSAHRERTFLTTLGITIGVTAVIAMASTTLGITRSISETLETAGPKTLYVQQPFDIAALTKRTPVTAQEAELIRRLPVVQEVNITAQGGLPVSFGHTSKSNVGIVGSSPNWPAVTGSRLRSGRNFTRLEYSMAARVAILNEQATQLLAASPTDRQVKINGEPFTVIGRYEEASLFSGGEPQIIIPYLSYRALARDQAALGLQLAVIPTAAASVSEASAAVTAALRVRRRLRPAEPDNFSISTQSQILEQFNKVTRTLFLVMMLLSSLGLIVGGVGVVAVMTISVTERTREIGIRKALGATQGEILLQFLVESAALTLAGCLVGLVFGGALAWLVRRFTSIPATISFFAVAAAMTMAILTGMLFGLYPASRAARLDPVAALRHE